MRVERLFVLLLPIALFGACSFEKLFERDDPGVEQARAALDGGPDADLQAARVALEELLKFRCESDGGQDLVLERPNAALDLGLVMFRLSELIGRRFGEEDLSDGGTAEGDELVMEARSRQLDCAHLLLLRIASDPKTPLGLSLRARYLLGNMAFLARKYKDAVARYDEVLIAHPARGVEAKEAGPPADDDAVSRYAAWNRAIALQRLENNDAGPDADASDGADGSDGSNDGSSDGADGSNDSSDSNDSSADGSDGEGGGSDSGQPESGGNDGGEDSAAPPPPAPSSTPPPMPSSSVAVDLRELDRFDQKAPLDLDFKARLRERKKLPKKLDK